MAGHGRRCRALYGFALHRLLRWWLPGYDPALHLGGIGPAFRGMAGPDVHSLSLATWVGPILAACAVIHERLAADLYRFTGHYQRAAGLSLAA